MKHLKSNYSNPQGSLPLFDSVKPNESKAWEAYEGAVSDFDGDTYEPKFDATRLRGEMARVYNVMIDNRWHTLSEIQEWIVFRGGPVDSEAGISARLRDFRKAKFGSHTVNRRRRGDPKRGIFEYQLL